MDQRTRIIVLLAMILVVSILLISLFGATMSKFSSKIEVNRTWTKAICNGKVCQDYEIACNNKNLVSLSTTGNFIKISSDWKDPRNEENINKLC
jgi:hypothetical protein